MKKTKPTLNIIARSTIFWVMVVSLASVYNLLAWTLLIFPVRIRFPIIISWASVFVCLSRYICGVQYVVTGQENLPMQPAIIASNHQSALETIAFVKILPRHVWVMKRELLRIPFFGWTLRTLWPIAINRAQRSSSLKQILTEGTKRIHAGFSLLLFPEGTRVAPGSYKPFKSGVAHLAISLNTAVIPVSHNAGTVMPKHSYCIYPGVVNVVIDKPIIPEQNETPATLIARIETTIINNILVS